MILIFLLSIIQNQPRDKKKRNAIKFAKESIKQRSSRKINHFVRNKKKQKIAVVLAKEI